MNETHRLFRIRKGFEDEKFTLTKPQTTYAGTDTRDVYYHGWDVSIETTPPRDKERQYQLERAFLMDKTLNKAYKMVKRQPQGTLRYGVSCDEYYNPEKIATHIILK